MCTQCACKHTSRSINSAFMIYWSMYVYVGMLANMIEWQKVATHAPCMDLHARSAQSTRVCTPKVRGASTVPTVAHHSHGAHHGHKCATSNNTFAASA